jgi:hypothetical protein
MSMSNRESHVFTAVALRQAWLDERLTVIESKLKIDAPPAPCPAPNIGFAGQNLMRRQEQLAAEGAPSPRGGGARTLYPALG